MTDRPKQYFDENDIPRLVRELPAVEADGDFRERLRNAFTEGTLEDERPGERESAGERVRAPWWRWLVPVTAAAVLIVAVMTLNRAPVLRITQATGAGEVQIDGRAVSLGDRNALSAGIGAGSEIETPPDALIDLLAEDVVLFEITGGTRMSIPDMPGRWFGRAVACSLFVGELRVKTGERFPGSTLAVHTPEGIVEITGTLLSIQRDSGGTCVCVLEGTAHVGVDTGDLQPVEPGFRKIMLRDGTVDIIPVKPMHRDGVLDFDKRVGHQIGRKR